MNSPVIIDMQTAIQHNPKLRPFFPKAESIYYKRITKQTLEIPKHTCSHTMCHELKCIADVYPEYQRQRCIDTIPDIPSLLDQDDVDDNRDVVVLRKIEDVLERDNLLILLPGVVHAFALRSRKWGE